MTPEINQSRDLVLPPNTYAHVLDSTKGRVSVVVGPNARSLSAQETLVTWDETNNEFIRETRLEDGTQTFVKADEGQYIVLTNPAEKAPELHPEVTSATDTYGLAMGRKIIIHGPANFALWPGQAAQVIDGHHLRSNQYLRVRVYEPEQARANAGAAVMAPQKGVEGEEGKELKKGGHKSNYAMGQLMVIPGTDVSFYIPPTGIEVIPDEDTGEFIREAVTLERLEHTILLDENGEKRYVQGPAVVFPEPTEQFIKNADGEAKAKAIELNALSGLYIKAVTDYVNSADHAVNVERGGQEITVEPGKTVEEGDELFITGETTPIYFPRPEHMLLTYRGQRKHHAIAIPIGEGRYVLERKTGNVRLVRGHIMFLPDPRREVIVQRILDPDTVKIMYPANDDALRFNQEATGQQIAAESLGNQYLASDQSVMAMASTAPPPGQVMGAQYVSASVLPESSATPEELLRSTTTKKGRRGALAGQEQHRGATFSKPRTIVLDTKYQGAVGVNLWPGYAVLKTNKTGSRKVEIGPVNLLLEYDEQLMKLSLSTGKPKRDDRLFQTVYLRIVNNRVSDQITVETRDLVPVQLDLALRVNFEDDPEQWFNVENYIQLLTDNCRSRLRNVAKRFDIQEFYTRTIDIIRDALLGEKTEAGERPGLPFSENGMRLFEVEVTRVAIQHGDVARLLNEATQNTLVAAIELESRERDAVLDRRIQEITRIQIHEHERTAETKAVAALASIDRQRTELVAKAQAELDAWEGQQAVVRGHLVTERESEEQKVDLARLEFLAELEALHGQTDEQLRLMNAINPQLADAIRMLGDELLTTKVVEALGPVALATNATPADVFSRTFKGTPLETIFSALSTRPHTDYVAVGNGQ